MPPISKESYMNTQNPDQELDVRAAAVDMEVCDETVRRLIRGKKLRAVKAGTKGYRIRRSWIEEYRNSTITMA